MFFHIHILFLTLLTFARSHVLISSFDENDIDFVTSAADMLIRRGIKCSLLIPSTTKDLILSEDKDNIFTSGKVNIISFTVSDEKSSFLEDDWSNPVSLAEVDSQLKICKSFIQDKEIMDHLLKDPPATVIFPSFLHDACLLPVFDYLNTKALQSPKQKGITIFVWTSNYLSDSWAYYHVTSTLMPESDANSGTFSRIKRFVGWWLFIRKVNSDYVEPAKEIISSSLKEFKDYFEDHHKTLPDLYVNRVNLTLVATHPLFTPPTPLALGISPITVNIGCFHCRPAIELSQELEKQLSKYKSGAIVIDVDFKSDVPENVRTSIIEASRSLPFAVYWQTHAWAKSIENMPGNLSESLLIKRKLPLQDLLGHQKCRLFVSRCSMESVLMSTYHGVPIICLPVTHFDSSVASYVEMHGVGIILPRRNMTGKLLFNAVFGVTNDVSFRKFSRHLAETLRDQPETPEDRFIYTIESLERHRGHNHYAHLKKQTFFSAHYWDICVAFTLSAIIIVLFASVVMWFLFCKFSDNEQATPVNSKKKI